MINNPTSAAEAVANGAQMLDEHEPGWWRQINLATLRISSCIDCVCGQLAGGFYADGRDKYMRLVKWPPRIAGQAYGGYYQSFSGAYGFNEPHNFAWTTQELDVEWGKAIKARLEADALDTKTEGAPEKELVLT